MLYLLLATAAFAQSPAEECATLAAVADAKVDAERRVAEHADAALALERRRLTAWQVGGTLGAVAAFATGTVVGLTAGAQAAATGTRAAVQP